MRVKGGRPATQAEQAEQAEHAEYWRLLMHAREYRILEDAVEHYYLIVAGRQLLTTNG
jgi:hypothetical protein